MVSDAGCPRGGPHDGDDVRRAARVHWEGRCARRWPRAAPIWILADPDGTSALVMAIVNGHKRSRVAAAREKGADPNIADASGHGRPLYAAVDMHTPGPFINRPRSRKTHRKHRRRRAS